MEEGVGRLLEFLGAKEKRGHLWNPTDSLELSSQSPPDLCQPRPPSAVLGVGGYATPVEVLSYCTILESVMHTTNLVQYTSTLERL